MAGAREDESEGGSETVGDVEGPPVGVVVEGSVGCCVSVALIEAPLLPGTGIIQMVGSLVSVFDPPLLAGVDPGIFQICVFVAGGDAGSALRVEEGAVPESCSSGSRTVGRARAIVVTVAGVPCWFPVAGA